MEYREPPSRTGFLVQEPDSEFFMGDDGLRVYASQIGIPGNRLKPRKWPKTWLLPRCLNPRAIFGWQFCSRDVLAFAAILDSICAKSNRRDCESLATD